MGGSYTVKSTSKGGIEGTVTEFCNGFEHQTRQNLWFERQVHNSDQPLLSAAAIVFPLSQLCTKH